MDIPKFVSLFAIVAVVLTGIVAFDLHNTLGNVWSKMWCFMSKDKAGCETKVKWISGALSCLLFLLVLWNVFRSGAY